MSIDKDQWKFEVINSYKGAKRAKPSEDLFAKIEQQIYTSKHRRSIISLHQQKWISIAASFLLILNACAIGLCVKNSMVNRAEVDQTVKNLSIISDYNLYE